VLHCICKNVQMGSTQCQTTSSGQRSYLTSYLWGRLAPSAEVTWSSPMCRVRGQGSNFVVVFCLYAMIGVARVVIVFGILPAACEADETTNSSGCSCSRFTSKCFASDAVLDFEVMLISLLKFS